MAPSLTVAGGGIGAVAASQSQALLSFTDDPASVGVKKWGVYRADTSGGTKTFLFWAYTKDQITRVFQLTGTTAYYSVTAWNALGEGPPSAELPATTASGNFNPLRVLGPVQFRGDLFYEPIGPDFKQGSTPSVTSSDGTPLTIVQRGTSPNFAYLVKGQYSTAGEYEWTWTETLADGVTKIISKQKFTVVEPQAVSYADMAPTMTKVRARYQAKPTYVDTPISITDLGNVAASGLVTNKAVGAYYGNSMPAPGSAVISGARQAQYSVNGWDPVEQKLLKVYGPYATAANTVLRFRNFKRTWSFPAQPLGSGAPVHFIFRYTDDGMQTWKELPDPYYLKAGVGTRNLLIDPGTVPPSTGRIWEVEFSSFGNFQLNTYGFGFEAGDTPEPVIDDSPIATMMPDSFVAGDGAVDIRKNYARSAVRSIGLTGLWNDGIPTHRYAHIATPDYPLALTRIGLNTLGIGDLNMPPHVEVVFINYTINDNTVASPEQWTCMLRGVIRKARYIHPRAMLVVTVGSWAPQDRIPQNIYDATVALLATLRQTDKGLWFNDGIVKGWAVPAGAQGSAPTLFHTTVNTTVTGSIVGDLLTVTSGSGLEPGLTFVASTSIGAAGYASVIYKQLSGPTLGGPGTYRLTVAPDGGDRADGTQMVFATEGGTQAKAVHPSPSGHPFFGARAGDGVIDLGEDIFANVGSPPTPTTNAALREAGDYALREDGSRIIREGN